MTTPVAAIRKKCRRGRQLPECYFNGFLEKRSLKDKVPQKLWTCLCGNSLYFFNDIKDNDYTEKVDLSGFVSITDDRTQDSNLEAARFILRLENETIKFTAPNLEARELWKGYVYSVVQLSVPRIVNLLPGMKKMLVDTVSKEKERQKSLEVVPTTAQRAHVYHNSELEMPECFQEYSRVDAVLMLEKFPDRGNMVLRPGKERNTFAVTTRQDLNGRSFIKHYRVISNSEGGFTIDVGDPVQCSTLHDVITFLVERTSGVLKPFIMEGHYDDSIIYVHSNEENGEINVQSASSNSVSPPPLPPKPGETESIPSLGPRMKTYENVNVNDTGMNRTVAPSNSAQSSGTEKKKPQIHPIPAPRLAPSSTSSSPSVPSTSPPTSSSTSSSPSVLSTSLPTSSSTANPDGGRRPHAFPSAEILTSGVSDELRLKLERRRKLASANQGPMAATRW